MTWDQFKEFMTNFRTDNIMQQLEAWNVGDLKSDPWFLGGFAAVILITYFLGMRAIPAFLVGIGGLVIGDIPGSDPIIPKRLWSGALLLFGIVAIAMLSRALGVQGKRVEDESASNTMTSHATGAMDLDATGAAG